MAWMDGAAKGNAFSAQTDGRMDTANANEFFSRLVTQLTDRLVARGADLATTGDLLVNSLRVSVSNSTCP